MSWTIRPRHGATYQHPTVISELPYLSLHLHCNLNRLFLALIREKVKVPIFSRRNVVHILGFLGNSMKGETVVEFQAHSNRTAWGAAQFQRIRRNNILICSSASARAERDK